MVLNAGSILPLINVFHGHLVAPQHDTQRVRKLTSKEKAVDRAIMCVVCVCVRRKLSATQKRKIFETLTGAASTNMGWVERVGSDVEHLDGVSPVDSASAILAITSCVHTFFGSMSKDQ